MPVVDAAGTLVGIVTEGNRIVLIAGPACQLAASGGPDIVTVAVSSEKDEKH